MVATQAFCLPQTVQPQGLCTCSVWKALLPLHHRVGGFLLSLQTSVQVNVNSWSGLFWSYYLKCPLTTGMIWMCPSKSSYVEILIPSTTVLKEVTGPWGHCPTEWINISTIGLGLFFRQMVVMKLPCNFTSPACVHLPIYHNMMRHKALARCGSLILNFWPNMNHQLNKLLA